MLRKLLSEFQINIKAVGANASLPIGEGNISCQMEEMVLNGVELTTWFEQQIATGYIFAAMSSALYNQYRVYSSIAIPALLTELGLLENSLSYVPFKVSLNFRLVANDLNGSNVIENTTVILDNVVVNGKTFPASVLDPATKDSLESQYGADFAGSRMVSRGILTS